MTERARPTFDQQAVAKALRTKAQEVTDPAYGDGQHFQVQSNKAFLSLDAFPEAGVSRITTKSARIELFGGSLPQVEDEGIVFLQKDEEHEHSTVALHPDGALTLGYQVDTGPASVPGLPSDVEDTAQIITNHEAVQTPTELKEPEPEAPPVVVAGPKPPEKSGSQRMPGAFPDERPMIQRVGATAEPDPTSNGHVHSAPKVHEAVTANPKADHPLDRAARIRQQDHARKEPAAKTDEAKEADAQRVKLVGRLGRNPTFRTTAAGKLVGKFPLAVHLENGETEWHDILSFGDRAAALQRRTEADELVRGREVEVVGYVHDREYKARNGETKVAREINSVAVKRR
ncbi:single-stranded DNA-binding protein [Streptomyces graminilatus]|uniref:single-stranded DNA-binding protein n=1 Tax=Streptomyces graminilatus TaxID=1464070 RepID=UPI00099F28E7|nr:single-stranded DNA-binding protein [Streptomyces graminilatus]